MKDYVKGMFESFPIKFKEGETATAPTGEDLFGQSQAMKRNYKRTRLKHFIQQWDKDYFLLRDERPDIHTEILFLFTQVQDPNEKDWEMLIRLMKYLNGT